MRDESLFLSRDIVESDRIIYTPSDFARTNLFHLQETGSLCAKKSHTSFREGLDSYLFFLVEEGSGYLTYCGEKYMLRAGDSWKKIDPARAEELGRIMGQLPSDGWA